MRKLFVIILFLLCGNIFAQYDEQINFRSIQNYVTYDILFGDVYKANTEIFKGIVKKIKVKDESGKMIEEISVNENGTIGTYKTYKGVNETKAVYDVKNNLSGIELIDADKKTAEKINLNYVGNTLLSYEHYLAKNELYESCTMRYDDAENKNKLTGFESNLWQGDSIPFSMNFKYDDKGRLYDVRVTGDNVFYYNIEYAGDTVKINYEGNSGYEAFIVREGKFVHHKVYSAELSFTGERDFEYDERGLVKRVKYSDNKGSKYFLIYEYDYWH
jgi:hypothetical protein